MKRFRQIINRLFLVIWLPVNIIVGLCTIAAAYGGMVNPAVFPLAQLVNMTFPIWLVISVLLLIINLFLSRRHVLWISISVLLLCSGPILTNCPLHIIKPSFPEEKADSAFTVMTYNVFNFTDHQGINPEWGNRTLGYIITADPDIVCLQEASYLHGQGGAGSKAQRDTLTNRYPYYIYSKDAGEMIMSRYPVERIDVQYPQWGSGKYSVYNVDIMGRQVTVINCHLQSLGLTPDDKALYRELTDKELKSTRTELSQARHDLLPKLLETFRIHGEQGDSLKALVERCGKNVILVGDFNDVPGSYCYRQLKDAGMRDAYNDCAFGPTITYNDNRFYFRIDHILYRGDMKAVRIKRGNEKCSDHYPLTATFFWDDSE